MDNTQDNGQLDSTGANQEAIDPATELKLLKERATLMGIPFSNNISAATLRERIEAKMNGEDTKDSAETVAAPANPLDEAVKPVKKQSLRDYLIKRDMKLVRLRITNLDPKKKDLPGEILTVANPHLGTVRKFIPFGEVTDGGYHVPYCLYQMMEARRFLDIRTRKVGGKTVVEQRWAKEFALDVLDPLTPDELAKLATAQMAAGSTTESA